MHQADPAQTLSRVAGLPRSARAAGLDVVEADGFFCPRTRSWAPRSTQARWRPSASAPVSERAASERAVRAGIAGYEWVTSPFLLDLVLRKPAPAR